MDIIKNKKFHFVAVGGVGMSALAKYLAELGAEVTGSDTQESKYTDLLKKEGVKITIGHDSRLVKPDMTIVASSAIKDGNPEIIRAEELNLRIYHRSDILKMISDEFSKRQESCFAGFSGTHGKTTTSGLCSYILSKAGYHPSFVVGGIIPELDTNGLYDGDKYFLAELDESDGTIQKYSTDIAVINNMEEDHLDYYTNGLKDISKIFNKYLSNKSGQKVIINNDNSGNNYFMKLYPDYNFITFGLNSADYTAKNIEYKGFGSKFDIYYKNEYKDTIELIIPGRHNVYNSLAVYSVLCESGIQTKGISGYFSEFSGMGRRFQKVCSFNDIEIYDDYAHHPSEIKMTLEGISKGKKEGKRLVAVFQPHRYTRLKSLWDDFKHAFDKADKLIILDVYPAGEDKIEGINSYRFSKEIAHRDFAYISGSIEEASKELAKYIDKNDIIITLGAGTITNIGKLTEENYKKANTIGTAN